MYHKIRITVASLMVMMICVLSSSTTLSYFTDTDYKMNSFIVGNASTTVTVYDNITGNRHEIDPSDEAYHLTDGLTIPFYPQASNDGNIPVYQRFRVVIPIALANVITLDLPAMNNNCVITTASENTCSNTDYTVTYKPSVSVENTPSYAEYYIVSNNAVDVNDTTSEWPMTGINIGNLSGIDPSLFTCAGGNANNCVLGVNIYSDVIQTTGFANALSAFASAGETY